MKIDKKICFLGGDLRFFAAAEQMASDGIECSVYGLDKCDTYDDTLVTKCATLESAVKGSSAVVLPIPFSPDNIFLNCPLSENEIKLEDLYSLLEEGQILLGGRLNPKAYKAFAEKGVKAFDYYESEELCVLNSIPTAEGAIAIAMNEMPITLHSARAGVIGFGRIGKTLSKTLCALKAQTSVAARKSDDLAWIKLYGYNPVHIDNIEEILKNSDVIFNTVPSEILTRERLEKIPRDTLLIDLASKPGGIDFVSAKELGLKCIWALSLPGKCSPVSSGRYIAKTLLGILESEGVD